MFDGGITVMQLHGVGVAEGITLGIVHYSHTSIKCGHSKAPRVISGRRLLNFFLELTQPIHPLYHSRGIARLIKEA